MNQSEGRGDASLRTRAEATALFDLLHDQLDPVHAPDVLTLVDAGQPTAVAKAIDAYRAASIDKQGFFDRAMYMVHVTEWRASELRLGEPVAASGQEQLALWSTEPADARHIPPPGNEGVVFATSTFSLMNSGNRTLYAPKPSWKVNFEVEGHDDRLVGMSRINLKAMYNDPSQMREALAWYLFDKVGVPAARHTYAKFAINATYKGLFSCIEQVEKRFLKTHFGKNDVGNLYKAYCGDIGCATLEHRVGGDGDDSGRQYQGGTDPDERTYRLKSDKDDAAANSYDDLARFVRVINGVGLAGGDDRFTSDAYRASVEAIFNVPAFLRWASLNILLGSWDNYFATPANYYLYNSGLHGAQGAFMDSPYFTFIPWDYDNSFGIDYFGTQWQYTDIVDWPSNTGAYWGQAGTRGKRSHIPLVTNLLQHHDWRAYYLDHLEHLLDTEFTPDALDTRMRGAPHGSLWERVSQAAYLEADTPGGQPFTGRQFTNDEVYRSGHEQWELRHGNAKMEGIVHYVRMRCDRARSQLAQLRVGIPSGRAGPRSRA